MVLRHTKPNYKSYKIFDNNLAPICKSKLLLRLVFTGMCLFGIKQSINVWIWLSLH